MRNRFGWLRMVALVVALVTGSPLVGQDWGAEGGEARRQEIVRRYREILEQRPVDGPILDRLLGELGPGGLDGLIATYRERVVASPDDARLWTLLGHLQRRAGKDSEALSSYAEAVRLDGSAAEVHRHIGDLHARQGRPREAVEAWERALSLAADNETRRELLRSLVDTAFAARDWEGAAGWAQRLVALDPGNPFVRMELAELFVRFQRYEEALAQIRELVRLSGGDTRQRAVALRDGGDILVLMGRDEEALAEYRKAQSLVTAGYWLHRELDQRLVAVHRRLDRLDVLVAELERRDRRDIDGVLLLGSLYEEVGREEDALRVYRRAVEREGSNTEARLAWIRILERRGDMEEVARQLTALVRIAPRDLATRMRLVDVLRRRNHRDRALGLLREAERLHGDDEGVLVQLADQYARLGARERALAIRERLVRLSPSDPGHLIALGEFHFMEGRRSEAERWWRKVLEVSPDKGEAHARLGEVYRNHELVEDAIGHFRSAVRLRPDDASTRRSLGRVLREAGRFPAALEQWTAILSMPVPGAMLDEARGEIVGLWSELGELPERVAELEARWSSDRTDRATGYLLAVALGRSDRRARAIEVLEELLETTPEDLAALQSLERILADEGRYDEAIGVLERIVEVAPERNRETYHRLAELSLRVFDDARALRFARLAVELNPEDATLHGRLASVQRRLSDLEGAAASYRVAIDLDPRNVTWGFELADVYLAQRRDDLAEEIYVSIVRSARSESDVLRAGRRAMRVAVSRGRLPELIAVLEPMSLRGDRGSPWLKLLVESWERLVSPLGDAARLGTGSTAEEAAARLSALAPRALRPLLDGLTSDDVTVRLVSIRVLGRLRAPESAPAVVRALGDADAAVRQEALLLAAVLADARAESALIASLDADDEFTRVVATWGLGRMGGRSGLAALRGVAADVRRSPGMRTLAWIGLGRHGAASGDRLSAVIRTEAGAVQVAALWAAGASDRRDLLEVIRPVLEHGSQDAPVAAALAVGAMTPDATTVRLLVDAWLLGADRTRSAASWALARLGEARFDREALERFDGAMSFVQPAQGMFDTDAYARGFVNWQLLEGPGTAVGVSGPWRQEVVDGIRRSLPRSVEARRTVLMELDGGGEVVTLSSLERACAGPEAVARVRGLAAQVAVALDSELLSLTRDEDVVVRRRASSVVGKYPGDPAGRLATLRAALRAPDPEEARAALRSLARLRLPEGESLVVGALQDPRWTVRLEAVRALSAWPGASTTSRLGELVASSGELPAVRVAAYETLLELAPDAAATWAASGFDGAPSPLRLAVARHLPELEWSLGRALAERALVDPDAGVRVLAREALARGGRGRNPQGEHERSP